MSDYRLRPATVAERLYAYDQDSQISGVTGRIGNLRMDFGDGTEWYSTFNDYRADLKSDTFRTDLNTVINGLREKGGLLQNLSSMRKVCYAQSDLTAMQNASREEYCFRADTTEHSFIIRCIPHKGDYNAYVWCYQKERLNRHLEKSENGIRFITSSYGEKFRIPDGDRIQETNSDGQKHTFTCRYYDDYHVSIGRTIWHICQYAEVTERNHISVIPLRSSLPDKCYAWMDEHMVMIQKGSSQPDFTGIKPDRTPSESVRALNDAMGISYVQQLAMENGLRNGWDTKEADPEYLAAHGYAQAPENDFEMGDD